jgi:hypothetical protein
LRGIAPARFKSGDHALNHESIRRPVKPEKIAHVARDEHEIVHGRDRCDLPVDERWRPSEPSQACSLSRIDDRFDRAPALSGG